MIFSEKYWQFFSLSFLLGLGTALVYPTFLAAIADNTHPSQRAECVGVFRLWRDGGYAVGAALTGILAEQFSMGISIAAVGALTILSAGVILVRMK
jgi:MFS family permease